MDAAKGQLSIFPTRGASDIRTQVIAKRQDFDALFEGFNELRAISYITSAELLLDLLSERGFRQVELLVGYGLDARDDVEKRLRSDLAQKDPEVTERLAEHVSSGALKLWTPKRVVHTKLYLLGGTGYTRIISTSANLTSTAQKATAQVNYAWYADLPPGNDLLTQVERDYDAHLRFAKPFLDELVDLFRQRPEVERSQLVSIWLGTEVKDEDASAVKAVLQNLAAETFAHPGQEEQAVIHLVLPTAAAPRRLVQRLLSPLGVPEKAAEASVSPLSFVQYVQETHGVPVMHVDTAGRELWLGFKRRIRRIDEEVGSPADVAQALGRLEEYVSTVDLGHTPGKDGAERAKASMLEGLLYFMAAPFANELMRERRRRLARVNRRGPLYLYIYGPAHNGKSTFLSYALNLITGEIVEPLKVDRHFRARISAVEALGTCFPVAFDDVTSATSKPFADMARLHWETNWADGDIFPQLIFTSNIASLPEWAKSRMKRLDFDVHFGTATRAQERLASVIDAPSSLFAWFAGLYLARIAEPGWLGDDELGIARDVMMTLYEHASKQVPTYFPRRPLEQIYDPDLRRWSDLVAREKVVLHRERDRTIVRFSSDMNHDEIQRYITALPQSIKAERSGNDLVIDNPAEFHPWLESDATGRTSLWRRLFTGGGRH